MKTLFLKQQYNPEFFAGTTPDKYKFVYKVVKVVDSIEPLVGAFLTRATTDEYCEADAWKVTIT